MQHPQHPDSPGDIRYRESLEGIVSASAPLMEMLRAARELDLPDWYIAAGAVRNLVWDHLHGRASSSGSSDVDLVYCDHADISPAGDERVLEMLRALCPGVPWEPVNQAGVHLWYPGHDGIEVPPLRSSEDGMATWPETATAVGVRLLPDDALLIAAPFGLDDLFELRLRPNLRRVPIELFRDRIRSRGWLERWPGLRVVE